jgi:hypothetical protein
LLPPATHLPPPCIAYKQGICSTLVAEWQQIFNLSLFLQCLRDVGAVYADGMRLVNIIEDSPILKGVIQYVEFDGEITFSVIQVVCSESECSALIVQTTLEIFFLSTSHLT